MKNPAISQYLAPHADHLCITHAFPSSASHIANVILPHIRHWCPDRFQSVGLGSLPIAAAALLHCTCSAWFGVTPRPGSPNEPLDNAQIVENLHETIDNLFDVISLFSKSQWKEELLKDSPGLMDNELEDIHNHFLHNMKHTAHLVRPFLPAVEAPASAVDPPAPRVIPRDAPPPADSSKSKPPKKKVRVEPAPSSDVTPLATAPPMQYISILLIRRVSQHVPAAFYYSPVTEAPNYSILRKRIQRDEVKRYQERKETETETKQIETLIQT
ncbi:hypothetical protein AGABI1DRAFT_133878 [Agaricus bisporus var. burnettii JB137-S8]|uniref:Uncharacterized protein n=1 Tax=Agaricus bisporus var. burnettii (strain JB137-S8 / ATCC MYA-4627 / FGSC 10392) TaxID=597362 RepID=K5XHL7_AGABU|nr:uncharacterized protein AGABI1DRAFT_133878 [Agaricus bisporus var. burnettii JB137-S8]EKM73915.1 hypothetical protein AGABI1DRAFT_133878 [Agaricus bisporus var. burnettii JB137-S8]